MTEIDQALEALRANPDDHKAQSGFYDLFLNMSFFVPTINETVDSDGEGGKEQIEVPLIVEADGIDYLVFFDQQERLNEWAEEEVPCLQLPGHVLVGDDSRQAALGDEYRYAIQQAVCPGRNRLAQGCGDAVQGGRAALGERSEKSGARCEARKSQNIFGHRFNLIKSDYQRQKNLNEQG